MFKNNDRLETIVLGLQLQRRNEQQGKNDIPICIYSLGSCGLLSGSLMGLYHTLHT